MGADVRRLALILILFRGVAVDAKRLFLINIGSPDGDGDGKD
jgi:hypothetical protein